MAGVGSIAMATLLGLPLHHPGPTGVQRDGPRIETAQSGGVSRWIATLDTHPATQWRVRAIRTPHAGGIWLAREWYDGRPIAGARLAIRVDPKGHVREVIGRALEPNARLPATAPAGTQVWWPTERGVVAATVDDDRLRWHRGVPTQRRRWRALDTGAELASESLIDEADVTISAWPENPLTTPDPVPATLHVLDESPLRLDDGIIHVVQCVWNLAEGTCDTIDWPLGDPIDGFPDDLPGLDDLAAHADPNDPWAGAQTLLWMQRAVTRLEGWGWDPYVWDEIDCEWQEVPPEECELVVRVNVLDQLEEDSQEATPFPGAFYATNSGVWMGQGYNADTSFDGDIVVHELGHHVTRGFGLAEPTGESHDPSRRFVDSSAINEASSDFLARQFFDNDRIYDYYSYLEPGTYNGERIRDVSIPFRCPENITGEGHMDGRIWVTAMRDVQVALVDAGLATFDDVAAIYFSALAAVRQLPRETPDHLQPGAAIVADEIELTLGVEARTLAEDILGERGLLQCERTLDVRDDPHVLGTSDAHDPLTARFLLLTSYWASVDPQERADHPKAPAVLHRVTLGADESRVVLRFIPDFWRAHPDVERPEFEVAMLVKRGDTITWTHPEGGGRVENDADALVRGAPVEGSDEGEHEIVVEGLEPGETYALGVVNLTGFEGNTMVINRMRWTIGEDDGGDDGGGEDEGADDAGESAEGGEAGTDGDTGAGGVDDGGPRVSAPSGCQCATGTGATGQRWGGTNWLWAPLLWFRVLVRRRRGAPA